MSLDKTNTLLKLLALLNSGPNQECTYELIELPYRKNIEESLSVIFDAQGNPYLKQPPERKDFSLRVHPLEDNLESLLFKEFKDWALPYPVDACRENVAREVARLLCQALGEVIEPSEIFEVFVSPTLWYEAFWKDLAFKGKTQSWLLHLGVSD